VFERAIEAGSLLPALASDGLVFGCEVLPCWNVQQDAVGRWVRGDHPRVAARVLATILLASNGVGRTISFELPLVRAPFTLHIHQDRARAVGLDLRREATEAEALRTGKRGRPAAICHAVHCIVSVGIAGSVAWDRATVQSCARCICPR
jgi:hypothetical protein